MESTWLLKNWKLLLVIWVTSKVFDRHFKTLSLVPDPDPSRGNDRRSEDSSAISEIRGFVSIFLKLGDGSFGRVQH